MADTVKLIGLDFGTTTSSSVVAAAQVLRTATGRMELDFQEEIFRSETVFTPLLPEDRLDIAEVGRLLDGWLRSAGVQSGELFGGGALLTGLTAQAENAASLVQLIRRRLGDALIATADDPCLESWVAFMGNCAGISQENPETCILNLDIGGGTTNIALGRNREVLRTGCLFVGARHIQVIPGTYTIVKLSPYAQAIFKHLRISKVPGEDLAAAEVDAFLTLYLDVLESVCSQTDDGHRFPLMNTLQQVRFQMPVDPGDIIVTFSGGVGELIYRHLQGDAWPPITHYGDLGIDLAQRIARSPIWANSLKRSRPQAAGRATVYGLLRHTTEVSGSTLFLGSREMLPLVDLPVLGSLIGESTDERVREIVTLVQKCGHGGCVQVRLGSQDAAVVRALGQRISRILQENAFPATHPLVLLVQENLGKVLGQYVTRWGAASLRLMVIDEVAPRAAQFVQIGSPRNQVVPVSYYGFLSNRDHT